MVRAGVALRAALRRADLDLDYDRFLRLDQLGLHGRQQRQVGGGGVAADPAGVVRRAQLVAVQLGQAIDEFLQPGGGSVRCAVPVLVVLRVVQTEVCRKVDDQRCGAGEPVDILLRLSVRQGQEEHVDRLERRRVAELEHRALAQVGMDLVEVFPEMAARGRLDQLNLRVGEQQAQQFPSRVAGGADDGDPGHAATPTLPSAAWTV